MWWKSELTQRLQLQADALTVSSFAAGAALAGDADLARQYCEETLADRYLLHGREALWSGSYKMILRSYPALGLALAFDLIAESWDSAFRGRMEDLLRLKARDLLAGGGEGWNDNPWSNWVGICSGTAGVCARVIGDEPLLRESESRVHCYLDSLGDSGWSNEGFNYVRFAMARGVLPLAWFCGWKGSKANQIAALYAQWTVGEGQTQVYGKGTLAWERSVFRSGDRILAWLLAEASHRAQLSAVQPELMKEDVFHPQDLIYAKAMEEAEDPGPAAELPRLWVDRKKALAQLRSEEGLVLSAFGNREAKRGAHSHRDGGAFRLSYQGRPWVLKAPAGQGRETENVILWEGCDGWPGGELISCTEEEMRFDLRALCLVTDPEGDRWRDLQDRGDQWTRSLRLIPGGVELRDEVTRPGRWQIHLQAERVEEGEGELRCWQEEQLLLIRFSEGSPTLESLRGRPKGADGVLDTEQTWWRVSLPIEGKLQVQFLFQT